MKKRAKIMLISIVILVLVAVILGLIYYTRVKDNKIATTTGVIVKVNEKSLVVMGIDNVTGLFTVGYTAEGNIGFKQGQEIVIYFDGMVMETYPAQLGKVGKIKIIKEKSDVSIPDTIVRFCYSSPNNVTVTVLDLTNKGIAFSITDTNELPYSYSNTYTLYKKVKNENYTGIGHKIGEDTQNSTAGYTGTGLEYIWEELQKNLNISGEDTVEIVSYELPDETRDKQASITGRKIDWTPLYGELEERRI